jgi:signal transduction histidine kinase
MVPFDTLGSDRALLDALLDALNEGVIAVNAQREVVRINETARTILRLREPVPFAADLLPEESLLRDALDSALRGRATQPNEFRSDQRTLSLTARPLPDGGALLAMYDLTPTRRLEAVRRDFVANVSHELRTPLTVISGFVETLVDDELPLELRHRFLGMAAANVRRMQRIVDDLLDLSRIESGGWLPDPTELDVKALAIEITTPLQADAAERGIALEIDVPESAAWAYVDPTAARQVLTNLTENAIRHTAEGRVTVFSKAETRGGVWLGVRDTGAGIAAEHIPRIFERFYRADPGRSREAGGTGLGLSIVRHLAEAHGGRVDAQSRVGEGTTIAAFFPAPRTR